MRHVILLGCLVSACADIGGPTAEIDQGVRFGAGDALDVGTTAAALGRGFTEANPVLGACGPAAPVCAAVAKPALKSAYVAVGMEPEEANIAVELPGWLGGCANIMTVAGAAVPLAVVTGLGCGIAYLAETGVIPKHERGDDE